MRPTLALLLIILVSGCIFPARRLISNYHPTVENLRVAEHIYHPPQIVAIEAANPNDAASEVVGAEDLLGPLPINLLLLPLALAIDEIGTGIRNSGRSKDREQIAKVDKALAHANVRNQKVSFNSLLLAELDHVRQAQSDTKLAISSVDAIYEKNSILNVAVHYGLSPDLEQFWVYADVDVLLSPSEMDKLLAHRCSSEACRRNYVPVSLFNRYAVISLPPSELRLTLAELQNDSLKKYPNNCDLVKYKSDEIMRRPQCTKLAAYWSGDAGENLHRVYSDSLQQLSETIAYSIVNGASQSGDSEIAKVLVARNERRISLLSLSDDKGADVGRHRLWLNVPTSLDITQNQARYLIHQLKQAYRFYGPPLGARTCVNSGDREAAAAPGGCYY